MGAAFAKLAGSLGPTMGKISRRVGKGDPATLIVRLGRFGYAGTATLIIVGWYAGWRNQRTTPGEYSFPFPGLSKVKPTGTVDRPDLEPVNAAKLLSGAGQAIRTVGAAAGSPFAAAIGAGIQGAGSLTGQAGIVNVGKLAQKLGGTPGEHPAFGGVHPVHAPNSLHNSGRAVDVTFPKPQGMDAFANMLVAQYGAQAFTELIWNGPHPVSIKNGRQVPPSFWGASTWANHKDHVHIGI